MICMPLPLQSERGRIEFIARCRSCHAGSWQIGLGMLQHWFTRSHASVARAHERPSFTPFDGLQMNHPTIKSNILKMQKPPLVVRHVHERTLMRAVYRRATLMQNDFV